MNLKPNEKSAILAGSHPEIVRPHENGCPFEVGQEIVLKTQGALGGAMIPLVSLTITGKHRKSPKAWEAIYSVKDERGVYVSQGPGYTRSPSRALDPEAPVLDPEVIEQYATEGVQKTALMGTEHRIEGKRRGEERKLEIARQKGHTRTVEKLERIRRAA